jgi:carboxymethylenebutenolidase
MILQEIFGVNAAMRAAADYFDEEGNVVLVPDLFWRFQLRIILGYSEDDRARAFDYFGCFDRAAAIDDMTATLTHMKAMAEVEHQGKGGKTQVATLRYCLGGALAYEAAAQSGVDAAASYYGVGIESQLDLADKVTCPVVSHFGSEDTHVTPDKIDQIKAKLDGDERFLINVYEGAGTASPTAFATTSTTSRRAPWRTRASLRFYAV